jgi:hypothetical protein
MGPTEGTKPEQAEHEEGYGQKEKLIKGHQDPLCLK